MLSRLLPERSAALAEGLRTLVPLGAPGARSFAPPEAFGAITLTPPRDAASLADTLVHEFQHAKLHIVLDLMPLIADEDEDEDEPCHYSPWRPDPRPLAGVLHGAYAQLAVTEFWDQCRHLHDDEVAHFEYARWRTPLRDAVAALLGSPSLTDTGRRFVGAMAERCDAWSFVPVSPETDRPAALWADDHRLRWRLRNLVPDPGDIARLAAAGPTETASPRTDLIKIPHTVATSPHQDVGEQRLTLARHLLRATRDPDALPDDGTELRRADLALLRGDADAARRLYHEVLSRDPGDVHAWADVALCEPDPDAALRTVPEVVRALRLARPEDGDAAMIDHIN